MLRNKDTQDKKFKKIIIIMNSSKHTHTHTHIKLFYLEHFFSIFYNLDIFLYIRLK